MSAGQRNIFGSLFILNEFIDNKADNLTKINNQKKEWIEGNLVARRIADK